MRKISLISLSALLFCSLVLSSCQKEEIDPAISNADESISAAARDSEQQAEIIADVCSGYLLTMENTPFPDLDIYYTIEEDSSLDYDQKYNALEGNPNALACLVSRKEKEDIVDENLIFLEDPMNQNIVADFILDDIGPLPIQDVSCDAVYRSDLGACLKTWTFCEGANCNKDYMDCNASAKSDYAGCLEGSSGGSTGGGGTTDILPNTQIYFQ